MLPVTRFVFVIAKEIPDPVNVGFFGPHGHMFKLNFLPNLFEQFGFSGLYDCTSYHNIHPSI